MGTNPGGLRKPKKRITAKQRIARQQNIKKAQAAYRRKRDSWVKSQRSVKTPKQRAWIERQNKIQRRRNYLSLLKAHGML